MLAGSSVTAGVRLAAWVVLVALGTLERTSPPDRYLVVPMIAATIVAAIALAETVASVWRGPPVISFAPEDAHWCGEEESEPVRAYAQLRGTIGGAGHVHPRRLVLPVVAWSAALLAGARPLFWPALEVLAVVPSVIAASGAFATSLFPSRPYWYREVMGGGAMVCPPEAVPALVARERTEGGPELAVIRETGRADPLLRTPPPQPLILQRARAALEHARHDEETFHPAHAVTATTTRDGARAAVHRRPPRWVLQHRIIVQQDGAEHEVATINVSDGGLAVRWPGELPVVGDDVVVKIEDGYFIREIEAEVRWNAGQKEDDRAVGLRLSSDGKGARAWRALVQGAAKSGAPSA